MASQSQPPAAGQAHSLCGVLHSAATETLLRLAAAQHNCVPTVCHVCDGCAGETGKSVSQYSAEWLKTVPLMRSVIKGDKPLSPSDVLVSMHSLV